MLIIPLELFNLLINPEFHNFALRWHRDDISEKATPDEERISLQNWHYGVSSNKTQVFQFWIENNFINHP